MKLQILVPRYKEPIEVLKTLLDSIAIQQNVNFDDIGVIVCNDGGVDLLDKESISGYPFKVEYYWHDHRGVSATRNACLDHATADYVMFCDVDDMFYNACGLYIVLREIDNGGFDTLVSAFIEETRDAATYQPIYINHDMDSTFVHGKIHKREYLLRENIRWNEALTIHEDSYFNCLCQKLTANAKYCQVPFYLWRWRDDSVCRHDPKYILKTYNNMLDSNTALVTEFERRGKLEEAQFYATSMIYDAYYTMNKAEWVNQENKEYRDSTEKRFKRYFEKFKYLYDSTAPQAKAQIIMSMKNRFFGEGLLMETVTFDTWIKHIQEDY